MGGTRVEALSEMETRQRMLSAHEAPDFVHEWQTNQFQGFARESLYVEWDDALYIDSDELSDEDFRSVDAFSSDDEMDFPVTIQQAASLLKPEGASFIGGGRAQVVSFA